MSYFVKTNYIILHCWFAFISLRAKADSFNLAKGNGQARAALEDLCMKETNEMMRQIYSESFHFPTFLRGYSTVGPVFQLRVASVTQMFLERIWHEPLAPIIVPRIFCRQSNFLLFKVVKYNRTIWRRENDWRRRNRGPPASFPISLGRCR